MRNRGKSDKARSGIATSLMAGLLLCWPLLTNGNSADSLKQQLSTAVEDSTYIKAAIQLSEYYERIDLDTAYHFAELALAKAQKAGHPFWKAEALNSIGIIQDFRGQYEDALQYYDRALSIYAVLGMSRKQAVVCINKGVVHRIYGVLDSAEANYHRALRIAEENDLTQLRAYILNNLANVHYLRGNLLKAVEFTLESLRMKDRLGDDEGIMYGNYNLGNYYYELKIPDKSLAYFNASFEKSMQLGDSLWIGDCYYSLSLVFANLFDNQDTAQQLMVRSYDIRKKIGYQEGIAECLNKLGAMAFGRGNAKRAAEYMYKALELSVALRDAELIRVAYTNLARLELGNSSHLNASRFADSAMAYARSRDVPKGLAQVYQLQMKLHRQLGNLELALEYYDRYTEIDDSLISAETNRQIAELETMYQLEKKDKEILAKELEVKKRDTKLKQQGQQLLALGGGSLAVLVILFLIVRNNRAKRKLHRQELSRLENERKLQLLKAMIAGEEKERTRISKDLHDGVSGLLSTVKLYFSSLGNDYKEVAEDEVFMKAKRLLDDSSSEVRKVAHNLMPELLRKEGLPHAVREFCNNIRGSKMLDIEFLAINMEERLSPPLELMLYRIIQELINNIIKHANATEAIVQISRNEDLLQISVEDNGRGFEGHDDQGAGLDSIKNRVNLLDGNMQIETSREMGTAINIEVYLNKVTSKV